MSCLLSDLLKPDVQFGAYATNVYIVLGRKGRACMSSPDPRGQAHFPLKSSKKSGDKTPLDVTNTQKKKRASKLKSSGRSKRKSTSRNKKPNPKANSIEVVEIDSSSEDEFRAKRPRRSKSNKDSWLDDDDDEGSSSDGTYDDNDELSESD